MGETIAALVQMCVSVGTGILVAVLAGRVNAALAAREQRERESEDERRRQRELRAAEHETLAALARARLVTMADNYIDRGYCPREARETFERLYGCYHAMGENGVIEQTVEEVRALPTHP